MNFSGKKCKKWPVSWKSTNTHRFGQDLQLLEETTMFWHFDDYCRRKLQKGGKGGSFREKWRKIIDLAKTFNFSSKLPCLGIFMNFSARSCKKLLIPWKRRRNHRFGQNYATFSNKLPCLCISINFSGKSCKKCLVSWESTKNHWFGQSFATFGTSYNVFFLLMNFQEKSCKKCVVSWKSTKNHRFSQLATLRENYHVLTFRWTLQQNVAKSCSCREKARKIIYLAKSLQLFEQTSMFLHFDEFSRKKLPNVLRFVKKHEKSSIWPKLCNFSSKLPSFGISIKFQQKVTKSASFREKARKIVDFAKTRNFSNKLPCFDALWTFQRKVAESASFSEKTLKIIDWAKTCNFFEQSNMFMRLDELFSKRKQKVPRFVKKHEKSSIWPKLATFRTNYHVLAFRWTFQEKNAKSGSFREKARTLIDLAKTLNFSKKLLCLCISINFSGKSCQKCFVSWKSTKNHRFGQNLQLFEQTTMFWHLDELFRKKMQKVARFVKKHEKLIDLAKTMQLFRTNYHVFAFRSTFREKVAKSASFRETARKIIDLAKALQLLEQATMSFSFWWTFKKKVAKSASSREKAPKTINFLNLQISEKTTMFWRFDEHCSKKLQKAARAVKKHEKSSIWPNLCNFSNKLRCFCISMNFSRKKLPKVASFREKARKIIDLAKACNFSKKLPCFGISMKLLQQKVTKSASFREKARKIVDLAKTRNFSNKLPCFDALVNFSAKSCRKCLVFWENSKNHRLGQNLQLFRTK